jgi:putative membrane protein
MAAAPLLMLGLPTVSVPWALPAGRARRIGRWWHRRSVLQMVWRATSAPVAAWVLSTGTLIVWHVPSWYEPALRFELLHALEHLTILGTALLFWRVVVSAGRSDGLGYGAGILFVFTSAVVGMAFAALITFANHPWYPAYAPVTASWGLTPLDDQALAGIMMWVPGKVVHLAAVLCLLWNWLTGIEHQHAAHALHGHRPVGRFSG